jgi:cyclase
MADGDSIYDGWGANQAFLVTDQGVLVVDTGFTRRIAEELLSEIRSITDKPVKLVINTHDHSDHVFGNSIFNRESVLILSHLRCRERLKELGSERLSEYSGYNTKLAGLLQGLDICLPSTTYESRLEFSLGSEKVILMHPVKGAHTQGDTMVLLPGRRVLISGDVVWSDFHPNLEDANIDGWVETLELIEELEIDQIIPGHGHVSDKSSASQLAIYLRYFDSRFKESIANGIPREKIASRVTMPGSEGWQLKMIIERNVNILYDRYILAK